MNAFAQDFETALAAFEGENSSLTVRDAKVLEAVHRLTNGVAGAWCARSAVFQLLRREGMRQPSLTINRLERFELIKTGRAEKAGTRQRDYTPREWQFDYCPNLLALTRDGQIEQVASAYLLQGES